MNKPQFFPVIQFRYCSVNLQALPTFFGASQALQTWVCSSSKVQIFLGFLDWDELVKSSTIPWQCFGTLGWAMRKVETGVSKI